MDEPTAPISADVSSEKRRSGFALNVIALLSTLGVIYFASLLLIPIAGAILLSLLFLPTVRWLQRKGIPTAVSAVFVVMFIAVVFAAGLIALGEVGSQWAKQAPETIDKLEQKLKGAKGPLSDISEATTKLEDLAKLDSEEKKIRPPKVEVESGLRSGALLGRVFSSSLSLLLGLLVCFVLTLFLLSSGDQFERALVDSAPDFSSKRRYVATKRETESVLGRYLRALAMINLGLGVVLWPTFHFLNVTNPLLWAITAAVLNFIPYVGGLILVVLLAAAGMMTQPTLWDAVLPLLVFAAINAFEGMVISPLLIGRWMKLSPIAVFLAVVVCGWFWGIAGALMAVPFLLVFCVITSKSERYGFFAKAISTYEKPKHPVVNGE